MGLIICFTNIIHFAYKLVLGVTKIVFQRLSELRTAHIQVKEASRRLRSPVKQIKKSMIIIHYSGSMPITESFNLSQILKNH